MYPHQAISQQLLALHEAVIDNCERAGRPDRTDDMALRLRDNAAVLVKLQLEMLALTKQGLNRVEPGQPDEIVVEPAPDRDVQPVAELAAWDHVRLADPDRILAGDALSRFVSRPLADDESPHEVWQQLNQPDPTAKRRRIPALPRKGFRSSPT